VVLAGDITPSRRESALTTRLLLRGDLDSVNRLQDSALAGWTGVVNRINLDFIELSTENPPTH